MESDQEMFDDDDDDEGGAPRGKGKSKGNGAMHYGDHQEVVDEDEIEQVLGHSRDEESSASFSLFSNICFVYV